MARVQVVAKLSAGVLLHRRRGESLEVLLVHPGGPFWANKDDHAWSIPKGEVEPSEAESDEDLLEVARRELREELGRPVPAGDLVSLGRFEQSRAKHLEIWALAADLDVSEIHSNTFTLEWPPRSGRQQEFPEVDRAAWFPVDRARSKLVKGQVQVLDALVGTLRSDR